MDGTQGIQQGAAQGGAAMGGPPGGFAGGPPGGRGGMAFLGPFGGTVGIALLVITYIVLAIAFWQFLKKAGLTPAIALLMLVPVVNLGVALWAAFAEWPALREVGRLKEVVATYELRASASAPENDTTPTPTAPAQ
jgi:hypothetical protein